MQTPTPVSSATCNMLVSFRNSQEFFFKEKFDEGYDFSIRSLDLDKDLPMVFKWVNRDYAIPFWQMNGSFNKLQAAYKELHACTYAHSFIGLLNEVAVCQLDAYDPYFDEVGRHYAVKTGDLGIHLLMCPEKVQIKNLSSKVVQAFCRLFFSYPQIERIIAEPDRNNRAANWLLRKLRFGFLYQVAMPSKTANLYEMTRESFAKMSAIVM